MSRCLVVTLIAASASCSLTLDFGNPALVSIDAGVFEVPTDDAASCTTATFFRDADGDGAGDPAETAVACELPDGFVPVAGDCDDADSERHPLAVEACNGIDDDCDDVVDTVPCVTGCADGEREGFMNINAAPLVAGCAGGFAVPGLATAASCGHGAGDDSANVSGEGCTAADLCAQGWHTCARAEVAVAINAGVECAPAAPALFFAVAQSGPGDGQCGQGSDDLFGCGNQGLAPAASCAPLDRFSDNLCAALGTSWRCGSDPGAEFSSVTKSAPGGGVACCRDPR